MLVSDETNSTLQQMPHKSFTKKKSAKCSTKRRSSFGRDSKGSKRKKQLSKKISHQVLSGKQHQKQILIKGSKVTGIVKKHSDGFGFLLDNQGKYEDLYLSRAVMNDVMSGDTVEATVVRRGRRLEGQSVRVIEKWPFHSLTEEELKSSSFDIRKTVYELGVPHQFSEEVVQDAKIFSPKSIQEERQNPHRKDLTHLPFVTIDGDDAKDFDDAICVAPLATKESGFKIFVAIADVSYYVQPNTPLDKEAFLRGNSTYFVNEVIPMLPSALSDHLCSLRPEQERLVLASEMDISDRGRVLKSSFYQATIKSHARLTYHKAQEIINTDLHNSHRKNDNDSEFSSEVRLCVSNAARVAKILLKQRSERGFLNMDLKEIKIVIDPQGEPKDLFYDERLFSHKVIEELMLLANRVTANFLSKKYSTVIYRVHENPDMESIEKLEKIFNALGIFVKLKNGTVLSKNINLALSHLKDDEMKRSISYLVLRAMKPAVYHVENKGHFGLSFKNYVHFTSPIRRYADLIIHRMIKGEVGVKASQLKDWADHCSLTEQRSVKAERKVLSLKKARFISHFVGDSLEGVISSISSFGFFVLMKRFPVEGLVNVKDLPRDNYEVDPHNLVLWGKRRKRKYRLGESIRVQVAQVDVQSGFVDLIIEE